VRELLAFGIVDRDLRPASSSEELRGRVIRALAAECRRLLFADADVIHRARPDRASDCARGLAVPDHLATPVGRWQPRELPDM